MDTTASSKTYRINLALIEQLVHGKHPTTGDYFAVHGAGLAFALFLAGFTYLQQLTSPWQSLALLVVGYDMAGGVMANITRSTNQFYQHSGWHGQGLFIIAHISQPLSMLLLFGHLGWVATAALTAYTLGASAWVARCPQGNVQHRRAMLLFLVGLVAFWFAVPAEPLHLAWFSPLYMLKLIYCFSVNHYPKAAAPLN